MTKHGLCVKDIRLYNIWSQMKHRCFNPKHKQFKDYGGRGITVCREWLDINVFFDWASQSGYNKTLSIDRTDNDGNYGPLNCKWATRAEQGRNTRKTLNVDDVLAIRKMFQNGLSVKTICLKYNKHMSVIYGIVSRRQYNSI